MDINTLINISHSCLHLMFRMCIIYPLVIIVLLSSMHLTCKVRVEFHFNLYYLPEFDAPLNIIRFAILKQIKSFKHKLYSIYWMVCKNHNELCTH